MGGYSERHGRFRRRRRRRRRSVFFRITRLKLMLMLGVLYLVLGALVPVVGLALLPGVGVALLAVDWRALLAVGSLGRGNLQGEFCMKLCTL